MSSAGPVSSALPPQASFRDQTIQIFQDLATRLSQAAVYQEEDLLGKLQAAERALAGADNFSSIQNEIEFIKDIYRNALKLYNALYPIGVLLSLDDEPQLSTLDKCLDGIGGTIRGTSSFQLAAISLTINDSLKHHAYYARSNNYWPQRKEEAAEMVKVLISNPILLKLISDDALNETFRVAAEAGSLTMIRALTENKTVFEKITARSCGEALQSSIGSLSRVYDEEDLQLFKFLIENPDTFQELEDETFGISLINAVHIGNIEAINILIKNPDILAKITNKQLKEALKLAEAMKKTTSVGLYAEAHKGAVKRILAADVISQLEKILNTRSCCVLL